MPSDVVLEARDIERVFRTDASWFRGTRELHALRGVSVKLQRGGTLGIVGESGSGKSTLARILLGLDRPDAGEVFLDAKPVGQVGRIPFARRVQPVFQDPYSSLNPKRTVAETVAYPLVVHGVRSSAERERRTREILDRVGLTQRHAGSYPAQLSGGQRQRVAIARALILQPEVVICDEPTSALDVSIQAQVLNLLRELQSEMGVSYVLISHNLAVVENLATDLAIMYLGRIVESGPAERILRRPGHPYTSALLDSALTPARVGQLPDLELGIGAPDPMRRASGCAFEPRCMWHKTGACAKLAPPTRAIDGVEIECHHPLPPTESEDRKVIG
ncbi:oligopeptide/dipeptide ABC transporter ATP-binding protein [Pukyongiella litopenaei]|uniref:Glutathione import ATP-binding protein GsiA n=1 Tax=Pukyongiella litopenaei TaxID=2605946 RepID=A0A5C2H2F6_9RHOB|nr:oligopeptide/dipeptide ABC transporter ATP-binding protein [Pukyongiella litopenaei]QEP30637.1 ATP-binding cassette domain-containing protein [Pukyongiella litopenaei]